MFACPWPATRAARLTISPTKFVREAGERSTVGETAFVPSVLVKASSKVVARERLSMVAKKLPSVDWRDWNHPLVGVPETRSVEVTQTSLEETGLTQILVRALIGS